MGTARGNRATVVWNADGVLLEGANGSGIYPELAEEV
jgi:hypothetical protein